MARVQRALISVSDKTGVVELARGLQELGVEILSTGGTAASLREAGVNVTSVEQVTGFPEMMEGRVKTLHPAVHGGILADRAKPDHMEQLAGQGFRPIDLVAVNLYPFAQTVARPGCSLEDAIENIDIGGPSMIRSAAKNHAAVTVITSPAAYGEVLEELRQNRGETSLATRRRLAQQAFAHTAEYDRAIAAYLAGQLEAGDTQETRLPERLDLQFRKAYDLRYGENPHQKAAFYLDPKPGEPSVATARQLHGKELSFTNILDLNAALELVKEFDRPACSIIKHTNPCGCAVADSLVEAYRLAREGELPPLNSRFGGIIACNRPIDLETAEEIIAPGSYYECIIAPGFAPEVLELFRGRKSWGERVRLMEIDPLPPFAQLRAEARGLDALDLKRVVGGLLAQERDLRDPQVGEDGDLQVATDRAPTEQELADMLFAWKVVRHVKSNAVVLAKNGQLIGVGAGQTNRVQSAELAVKMAGPRAEGSVCASDAYFPFPDGPEALAKEGVKAIIQPGGSVKDQDTVFVCNQHGVAMVFTGARHFRH
ncbi:MAG: bifunctional phosphoribosylaminoimidazolecarboxamide formyltransferase/IMP cyclohydrolase [Armatimonadota bacterium]